MYDDKKINRILKDIPDMTTHKACTGPASSRPRAESRASAPETVHSARLDIRQELEMARRLRQEAQQYHREATARARSEAQQLVLKARLQTQREVTELVSHAREEIQKLLADIRIIRITAQEELAAQRKFTDAARLCSMTRSFMPGGDNPAPEAQKKARPDR